MECPPLFYMDIPVILTNPLGLTNFPKTLVKCIKYNNTGFPCTGLYIYTGSQGSGKTLSMVNALYRLTSNYPKVKVYSNMHIDLPVETMQYTGLECFDDANGDNGIIYIFDEIHTLWCSMDSAKMTSSQLTVWSQNRKNRRLIVGTSQRFNRVAKALREQCTFNIECKKSFVPGVYFNRIIDGSCYDDNGKLIDDDSVSHWTVFIPNHKVFDLYDTLQVIKRSE